MKQVILTLLLIGSLTVNAQQTKKPTTTAKKPVATKPATKPSAAPASKERLVELTTDFGKMVLKLYDSTPLHRDNFIKLVQSGFYDSFLFHLVIQGFMIQGGDPSSKYADSTAMLGGGSAPGERIPAEFKAKFFHKKGALAAARDGNPAKASSNCQFYIVQGNKLPADQLAQQEQSVKANSGNPNIK